MLKYQFHDITYKMLDGSPNIQDNLLLKEKLTGMENIISTITAHYTDLSSKDKVVLQQLKESHRDVLKEYNQIKVYCFPQRL